MRTWKEWTTRQHAILDRDYPDGVPLDVIAQRTGHSVYAVKTRAAERGLVHPNRSSQACIARFERQHGKPLARIALWYRERRLPRTALAHDIGIEIKALRSALGGFQPGQEAWNKGMTGLDLGSEATRFKKGQKPATWAPLGSERLTKDGYRQRKVTDTGYPPRDWRMVHHLVWEEHNGRPVPEGHIVIFRDGDKHNVAPENLLCITKAENMRRNTIHRLPPELADICRLRGSLTRKINRRARS